MDIRDKKTGIEFEVSNEHINGDYYAGENNQNGWRLPTIKELKLMYQYRKILKLLPAYYWSSDKSEKGGKTLHMDNGSTIKMYKNIPACIRLVRDLK